MSKLVYYHANDLDGKCSGEIVRHFNPDAEMIGIDYGFNEPDPDDFEGKDVVMVDFCLQPFSRMAELVKICRTFLWIDHHKSAIQEYNNYLDFPRLGNVEVVLDTKFSACELVYRHYAKESPPLPVYLLGRYDVWDLDAHPDIMAFQWGMRMHNTVPGARVWIDVGVTPSYPLSEKIEQAAMGMNEVVIDGKTCLKYRDMENEAYVKKHALEIRFEGRKFIAINRGITNSQMFDSIWDENKYDGMLTFCRLSNRLWTVSMYSTNKDLSKIAQIYGGGGHAGACGFQCEDLPFKI